MFANAYKIATKFTRPVIISIRTFDGKVNCGCGSYILLNKEGWILTAAHILDSLLAYNQNKEEIKKYNEEVEAIKKSVVLNDKQKRKKVSKLNPNKNWITNHSFWWGIDGIRIEDFKFFHDGDIAIGQIKDFKADPNFQYPRFKNPKIIEIGTSLCKLGFPFSSISATFDESRNSFNITEGLPLTFFPMEGIYTRNIEAINQQTGKKAKFLETSSPGLKGQSGGPIFDKNGLIWAIQCRTQSFSLGFTPSMEKGGKTVEEHQFLNVGWGIHPEMISEFLNEHKISFELAD